MVTSPTISMQMEGGKWKQWQILFSLGSKITADSNCSHEIKWCLVFRRKAMTNLDSILKSIDITLLTKVSIVKWSEVKRRSLSCVQLFATPWTVAYQAPSSMRFSRQEYWSGLPFPSPGDLPEPGIKPGSLTLRADALTSEPPGKAMVFKVVMYRCESLGHKEGWALKNWCSQIVVLKKTLENLCTARRSNQSILKEIKSEYSLEGLLLKLKLQCFGHLTQPANSLEKNLMLGKIEGKREEGSRGWDGHGASLTLCTWNWANSEK